MNMTSVATAAIAVMALTAFSASTVEENSARKACGKAKVAVNGDEAGGDGFSVVSNTVKVKNGNIVPGKKGKCCKPAKGCQKGGPQCVRNRKKCNDGKGFKCDAAKKDAVCPKKCGKSDKPKADCKKKRGSGSWSYEFKDADGNPVFVTGMSKSIVSYTDPATGEMKTISSEGEPFDVEKLKELTGVGIEDLLKDIDLPGIGFDVGIDAFHGRPPHFPPPRAFMRRNMPQHRKPVFNKRGPRGRAEKGIRCRQQKIDELSAQVEELKKQIEQLKAVE